MRWLTDDPEQAGAFLDPGQVWHPAPQRATAEHPSFWSLLAGTHAAWGAEGEDATSAAYPDRRGVIVNEAASSQFTTLVVALKAGVRLPDGLACIALAGQHFHGQRNRAWHALRGNLHLTVYYRLEADASRVQAGLAMAPAVAVTQALCSLSVRGWCPVIKWTNDILINGKKVAGVLTSTMLEGSRIQHVVFGVGMNIDRVPDLVTTALAPPPGALAAVDSSLRGCLPQAFRLVVQALDDAMAQVRAGHPEVLFESYRRQAGFLDRVVSIWSDAQPEGAAGEPLARGRVVEVRPDLSLVLEGVPEPVTYGRLVLEDSRGWNGPT